MIQVFRNTQVAVLAGGELTFTNTKKRKGCTATLDSGGINLNAPGIYEIIANFSFNATAAGDVTITQQVNGVNSAADTGTTTAAADGTVNITIPSIVSVDCCNNGNPLDISYIVNTAGTLISANAVVTKIC